LLKFFEDKTVKNRIVSQNKCRLKQCAIKCDNKFIEIIAKWGGKSVRGRNC
jgi:hypothetical protein